MNPGYIECLCAEHRPEWFKAEYIFETEPNATSIIKHAWSKNNGAWTEISRDFDENGEKIINRTKIKFFTSNGEIVVYLLDMAKRFSKRFTVKQNNISA